MEEDNCEAIYSEKLYLALKNFEFISVELAYLLVVQQEMRQQAALLVHAHRANDALERFET